MSETIVNSSFDSEKDLRDFEGEEGDSWCNEEEKEAVENKPFFLKKKTQKQKWKDTLEKIAKVAFVFFVGIVVTKRLRNRR